MAGSGAADVPLPPSTRAIICGRVRRGPVILAVAVLALALSAGVAAPSASALAPGQLFGMGDQDDPAMFTLPGFAELEVGAARLVVSWDVAVRRSARAEAAKADAWYAGSRAAGARPLLALGGFRRAAPSPRAYERALRAALRRWPRVEVQAWNEANHPSQPATYRHPARAAAFARIADRLCARRCTTVPTSIVIGQAPAYDLRWTAAFVRAYGRTPRRWGLHAYGPSNHRTMRDLAAFLRRFPRGDVWITETAAWFAFRDPWPPSAERQAARAAWVFRPARQFRSRVRRLYWYEFRGPDLPDGGWDSGLLAGDGSRRPVFDAVLRERFRH
jgi:hypothetical protein